MRNGGNRHSTPVGSLLAGPSVPLTDWELWACANTVLKTHGDKAASHVAGQIGALALKDDQDGICTWQEIAKRIVELQASADAPGTPH